jgi:hypothetical protein
MAAELGRKGGQRNRHVPEDVTLEPLNPPRTAAELKEALAVIMSQVHSRKLDQKVGTGLAFISNSLLRAIEVSDLEARLRTLEMELLANEQRETQNPADRTHAEP